MRRHLLALSLIAVLAGCSSHDNDAPAAAASAPSPASSASAVPPPSTDADIAAQRMANYASVKLTADLSHFDDKQKQMIALLIEAADVTNDIY